MSTSTFTPEHFIESKDGVLRQLESVNCKKATVVGAEYIPRDREYIVVVPKDVKVSKKFLRDTPNNVVFVIDNDNGSLCGTVSDENFKDTKSLKCFYVRNDTYTFTFTDSRLPGLLLRHVYYGGSNWCSDKITLKAYFEVVMSKSPACKPDTNKDISSVSDHVDWNKLFESAFNTGLERRKKRVAEYLSKAVQVIPDMIENGKREHDFSCIPDDILEELNKQSPTNVRWVRNSGDNALLTITL